MSTTDIRDSLPIPLPIETPPTRPRVEVDVPSPPLVPLATFDVAGSLSLDALRVQLDREPTAEDIETEKAREIAENPLRVVSLPGRVPAGFPIVISVSADPAAKATTKANHR